ncbi:hypothetical protein IUY40_17370 [Flavobacterium sp. ALJ2]|uniref:sigma factor-like helix-turn-helix DNA-binding protein n=1 Tax=Flavobacterium sp. ALJ2 TaxID=2786960 RepID=UPI00189F7B9B|nr:sigma factor-like helix-turn-helix DNA-binding protein [Flavobacterium sp. ALJ2]MBF7093306.1 hypothetical protein [Flavobacterium sp. ALJ2]
MKFRFSFLLLVVWQVSTLMSQTTILPSERLRISLDLYENSTSKKEKANTAIMLAESYYDSNEYERALNFATIAKIEADKSKSIKNSTLSCIFSGKSYVKLGLYDLAKKAFYDGLNFVNKNNKNEIHALKSTIYNGLANSYSEPNKIKFFLDKNYEELKHQEEGRVKRVLMNAFYADFGNYYYNNANNDLAKYYFKKVNIVDPDDWKSPQFKALLGLGYIYALESEYDKAINCFEKGLSKSLLYRNKKAQRDFNLVLFKNSKTKKEQYFVDYSSLNNTLQKEEALQIKKVIEAEANKDGNLKQYVMNKMIFAFGISIAIVILTVVAGFILFKYYKEQQKNKPEQDKFYKKEASLVVRLVERKYDVDGLLQLVKDNDLADLASKMKLLYPDFVTKLSTYLPKPSAGELILSVLVRMNFSNKEIAEVLDMSLRAVESRKYRLRKKINLLPEEDMNLWMINL